VVYYVVDFGQSVALLEHQANFPSHLERGDRAWLQDRACTIVGVFNNEHEARSYQNRYTNNDGKLCLCGLSEAYATLPSYDLKKQAGRWTHVHANRDVTVLATVYHSDLSKLKRNLILPVGMVKCQSTYGWLSRIPTSHLWLYYRRINATIDAPSFIFIREPESRNDPHFIAASQYSTFVELPHFAMVDEYHRMLNDYKWFKSKTSLIFDYPRVNSDGCLTRDKHRPYMDFTALY